MAEKTTKNFAAILLLFSFVLSGCDDAYGELKQDAAATAAPRAIVQDMAVETAYGAIPHQRTAFRVDLTSLPDAEADYLAALFRLTDAGVVERVSLQQALRRGADWSSGQSNYDAILQAIAALDTPRKLLPVERLIFEAVTEQRRYLENWRESGDPRFFDPKARLVGSSHGKLIAAYHRLIKLYGGEARDNKQAFFDHLCALDFI